MVLRAATNKNPWQNGEEKWTDIAELLKDEFKTNITPRTIHNRVNLLLTKYRFEDLKDTSGTEADVERRMLLDNIVQIIDKKAPNETLTEPLTDADVSTEVNAPSPDNRTSLREANAMLRETRYLDLSSEQERAAERAEFGEERNRYLDEAIGTTKDKGKRRLSPEEEFIKERQDHDIQMEKSRLELEKSKVESSAQLEKSKIELEAKRLDIEKDRLKFKEEESRQRNELAKLQIEMQSKLLEVMKKVVDK